MHYTIAYWCNLTIRSRILPFKELLQDLILKTARPSLLITLSFVFDPSNVQNLTRVLHNNVTGIFGLFAKQLNVTYGKPRDNNMGRILMKMDAIGKLFATN